MNQVILYEELSMNAHPSIRTQVFDGWVLRFADGYTKRANSVNPLYPSEMAAEDKIDYCEKIYKSQGLAAVFKLTPLSFESLDRTLGEKHYEKVAPTNLMTKPIAPQAASETEATVTDKIGEVWQENFFRLNGVCGDSKIAAAKTIQGNILNKTLCASIVENGAVIACGLCVVEREYAGLYDIVVDTGYRGKGFGRAICRSLLDSAAKIGAKTAYLQVIADNAPAVGLYNKLGFTYCYQYWYRVKK